MEDISRDTSDLETKTELNVTVSMRNDLVFRDLQIYFSVKLDYFFPPPLAF